MDNTFEPKTIFFLLFSIILSIWIYYPGLSGAFVFDDNPNIVDNGYLKIDQFSFEDLWQASISSSSGPLRRPVSMLSFAINHVLTGMDPWWMKVTNLCIHIFNALILLLVLRQVFTRLYQNNEKIVMIAPLIITTVWLVHPIHITSVSYIVQRMTLLSATFVLLALYGYLKLRALKLCGWRSYLLSLSILNFWLLGLFSKETAVLLSIYIFVIEWCLYGFRSESRQEKIHLSTLWTLLAIPWAGAFIYILYQPSFIFDGYVQRDFIIVERVLTEFRIVIEYLRLIFIPDIRHMGIFHDDIVLSRSLLNPVSTVLSLLLIIGLLVLAIRLKPKLALFSLGILWFFGGHVLESSIYPLEIMFLHRNYLPSVGILLVLTEVGYILFQHYRTLAIVTICAVVLGFSICTRSLAHQWSDDYKMLILEAINNPKSVRANSRAGQLYRNIAIASEQGIMRLKYRREAEKYFKRIRELDPQDVTGELSILKIYLRFGEAPPKILLDNLIQAIATAKIKMGTTNVFRSLNQCLIEKGCYLEAREFHRLLQALLSNPSISDRQKGELLGNYAAYVLALENDLDKAISIVLQAINGEPSMLELYELLIYYYDKRGDVEGIKQAIDTLDSKDRLGRYRKYLRQVREEVNASVDLPHTP